MYAGTITAAVPTSIDGDSLVMTVDISGQNTLILDGDGNGTIRLFVSRYISEDGWNAIVPLTFSLSAPCHLSASNQLIVSLQQATLGSFMPYPVFGVVDADGDGILNYTLDRAAFLAKWSSQNYRADVNFDGTFTQADIDRWEELYATHEEM